MRKYWWEKGKQWGSMHWLEGRKMAVREYESRRLKEWEGGKKQVSRHPSQFKLPKRIFLQESLLRGLLLDYYLPAIECLCYHTQRSAGKKTAVRKMLLVFRQVFLLIFCSYLFLHKQYLLRLWRVGRVLTGFFWFQAEELNENCNCKCFPMEFLWELCSLLPLLQLHNPTETKSDEISGGSRCFKALNSLKSCHGYQEREHLEPGNSPATER